MNPIMKAAVRIAAFLLAASATSCSNGLTDVVKKDVSAFHASSVIPTITVFVIGPDVRYDDFVPVTLEGSTDVSAWLVNEAPAKPAAADPGWSAAKPATYTVSAGLGLKTLYAWGKSAPGLVSDAKSATVTITSYASPVIDTFNRTSATPTDDPTVTFNLSTSGFGAGASSIVGWLVNESSSVPAAADVNLSAAPTSYTVSLASGTHTVYAWAKNDKGLVNAVSMALSVAINSRTAHFPTMTTNVITGHERLTIGFDFEMDPASISFTGGTMTPATPVPGDWDSSHVSLPVKPSTLWPRSTGTTYDQNLTISGKTKFGISIVTATATYNVFYGACVSETGTGSASSDDNGAQKPFASITAAVNYADTKYSSARPCEVRVSKATYSMDGNSPANRVSMKDGISVLGGYPPLIASPIDWSARNSTDNTTTIVDSNTTTSGGSEADPKRPVDCASSVTTSAVLDGFTIKMGRGDYNAGIFSAGAATISNNIILGRTLSEVTYSGSRYFGIYVYQSAPVIRKNTIEPGYNNSGESWAIKVIGNPTNPTTVVSIIEGNYLNTTTHSTGASGATAGGIFCTAASGTTAVSMIRNNVILGGGDTNSTTTTYGIMSYVSPKIYNNDIYCGQGATAYCIYNRYAGNTTVKNNILFNGSNTSAWGLYEYNSSSNPAAVDNNDFYISVGASNGYYRDYDATPAVVRVIDLVTNVITQEGTHTLGYWKNLAITPSFVSGTDYHLQATSTLKATVSGPGLNLSTEGFSTDMDGNPRSSTGYWSIGAFE